MGMELFEAIQPILTNVKRIVQKDDSGSMKVSKDVRYMLEDVEDSTKILMNEFEQNSEALQVYLQFCTDPADPMRLQMAEQFAVAKLDLTRLNDLVNSVKSDRDKLLRYFHHSGMKTCDFFILWDNLFVPPDVIMNCPQDVQKKTIFPRFCKPGIEASLDDFLALW